MNKKTIYYSIAIATVLLCLLYSRYVELLLSLAALYSVYYLHLNFKKLFTNTFSSGFTRSYVFNSERDILTYEAEGSFISVCAIECFLQDKGLDGGTLEKLVNSVDHPLKIVLKVQSISLSSYTDWLKEERSKLEYRQSRLEDDNKTLNSPEISQLERKISQLNSQLDRISKGEKPYAFRYMFIIEASGRDYIESINCLSSRASSVHKLADALFSGSTKRLKGHDLYGLF